MLYNIFFRLAFTVDNKMVSIDMTGKVFIIYRVFYTVPYSLKSLITFGYATYRVDNLKLMYIH